MDPIDYLIVGHVTWDLTPTGRVTGGPVNFAGRTAWALGCRTAALTSAAPDYDLASALDDVQVRCLPARETTTFANYYTAHGRQQWLHGLAAPLSAADVPAGWDRPAIAHLAPVAGEVDPDMIDRFSNSLVGLTPQGWLRRWDESGRVWAAPWAAAEAALPLAAAVILSEEDLTGPEMLDDYIRWARLLVLTQGARGCTVYWRGESRLMAAPAVEEVNPTGAGDVFAAAFLVRLLQTDGNPWDAAKFANRLAARSVTAEGVVAKVAAAQEEFAWRYAA